MKTDARDLPISTDSDAVVAAVDRFTLDFLGARQAAATVLDLAAAHPDCAMAQIYAAAMYVYSQSTLTFEAYARPLLARAAAAPMQTRERLLAKAVGAAIATDYARAIACCEAIAADWPRDVVAAKFAEFMFYLAPDYARHRRFMERIAPANQGFSHFDAMLAFALELDGEHARAERVAEAALASDAATPWAHHALAHVYLNDARLDQGLALLEHVAPSWRQHVRSMRCHNGWHLALLQIASLRLDAALAQYRDQIWGVEPDNSQEHIDGIALLWRLDLAARPADAEWQAILPHIVERAQEQVFPFLTAHYVYALVRAGAVDAARAASASMAAFAARQRGDARRVWHDVGIPLVEGCIAFAAGDNTRCATLLEPILAAMACVGGSDAQNDLFKQTHLLALIGSGRAGEAQAVLRRRIGGRQPMPLEREWLARAS